MAEFFGNSSAYGRNANKHNTSQLRYTTLAAVAKALQKQLATLPSFGGEPCSQI